MRPARPVLLSLLALALALPLARADAPPGLDGARTLAEDDGDPEVAAAQAAAAWTAAGVTPDAAAALLAGAQPLEPGPLRDHHVVLVDQAGQKSDTQVLIPDAPRADGRYGVLIVLHGLRGNAGQLLPYARRVAPPGYIIVAPTAQPLAVELENEDMPSPEQLLGHTPAPAPDETPEERSRRESRDRLRAALRQVAEAGQKGLFPHWWSYKADSFALLALDHVRAHYPVDPDRVVLTGYSMGGYGTWNLGLRYPDRFAAIAPHAGGISRRENVEPRDERSRALLANSHLLPIFAVHGGSDPVVPTRFDRTLHADLLALGADTTYEEVPGGGHILMGFLEGDEHLQHLKAWMAERVRDAHPRKIEHAALGAYSGADRWVRIDEVTGDVGHVVAVVSDDGRTITVDARNAPRLTVFLDPTLVPADGPVRVLVNGAVVHDGPVAPSLEAVARSFAGRHDPSLVYTREVRVAPPAVGNF